MTTRSIDSSRCGGETRSWGRWFWVLLLCGGGAVAQQPVASVRMTPPGFEVDESAIDLCVRFDRVGDPASALDLIVDVGESPGSLPTATLGVDYVLVPGQVKASLEVGQDDVSLCPARIVADELEEMDEFFELSVLVFDASTNELLDNPKVRVIIRDDDVPGLDLEIRLTSESPVHQGVEFEILVEVYNRGTVPATGVQFDLWRAGDASFFTLDLECDAAVPRTSPSDAVCTNPGGPLLPGESWFQPIVVDPRERLARNDPVHLRATVSADPALPRDVRPENDVGSVLVPRRPENLCIDDLDLPGEETIWEDLLCGCFLMYMEWASGDELGNIPVPDPVPGIEESSAAAASGVWPRLRRAAGTALSFFERADTLFSLYRARDRMQQNPGGRRGIELYYRHSREIRELMTEHPEVLSAAFDVFDLWGEHLRAFVDGTGGNRTVTGEELAAGERFLDLLESLGSEELRAASQRERAAVELSSLEGVTLDEGFSRLDRLSCVPGLATLCLDSGRFAVDVAWADFEGRPGVGTSQAITSDTGAFWFFGPQNLELLVKVLDGRAINQAHWVFYGSLTNVAFELSVTDLQQERVRTYRNHLSEFASVGDIEAFPELPSEGGAAAWRTAPRRERPAAGRPAAGAWRVERLGFGAKGVASRGVPNAAPGTSASCVEDAETHCLLDGRFAVSVQWTDFAGASGPGVRRELTADTGAFWFFEEENLELMVKVLDGTAINGSYWVFFGSLSNVGFELQVVDTLTGESVTYSNQPGQFTSNGDTEALHATP